MKNAFQKATKILIAILITSVVSCQNDDDQSVSIAAVKSKNIQTINIEQLKPKIINNEILLDKLSRNFKKKNYRRTENGYVFDLDSIKQYENGNYSSYTVIAEKIVPDSSNYIYKLLIEENQDTIKTSMLTFDLKDGNLVPIVKEDFTSNTPAKLECITVTVVTDCTCHTHGSASCTHPTYTTVSSCSGGSSNPGNGQAGGTPTTTPTNPSGSGVNPVIVIDQEDAWIRFNSFKSRLSIPQKNWLNENLETQGEIFAYLWSKGFSGSSQAYTKQIINAVVDYTQEFGNTPETNEISEDFIESVLQEDESIIEDDIPLLDIAPDCDSFQFINTGSNWQMSAVTNIHFVIALIGPNGADVSHVVDYPRPILFGCPRNLAVGNTTITPGMAASLSATALYNTMREISRKYANKRVSWAIVHLEFEKLLKKNYKDYVPGGRVDTHPQNYPANVIPTAYQSSAYGDNDCE